MRSNVLVAQSVYPSFDPAPESCPRIFPCRRSRSTGNEIVITEDQQLLRARRATAGHSVAGRPAGGPERADRAQPRRLDRGGSRADGTVSLWDRRTGTRQSLLPPARPGRSTWHGARRRRSSPPSRASTATSCCGTCRTTATRGFDIASPTPTSSTSTFGPPRSAGRSGRRRQRLPRTRPGHLRRRRGRACARMCTPGGQIGPIFNSPDGKTMATMRYLEGVLMLFDAASGRVRATRPVNGHPPQWAFVHGGRRCAIPSVPGAAVRGPASLELWDATTLETVGERVTFAMNAWGSARATRAPTAPSSSATGARRGPLGARSVELGSARRRIAGRNLTLAEWNQYFPGRDYHRTCPT